MSSNPGISVHLTFTVDPSNVDKFFEHFYPVYEAVIAEPECTFFEVYQAPDNAGVIHAVENWSMTVEELMEKQIKKPYYKPFEEAAEPLLLKPREAKVLNRVGKPYFYVKGQ